LRQTVFNSRRKKPRKLSVRESKTKESNLNKRRLKKLNAKE